MSDARMWPTLVYLASKGKRGLFFMFNFLVSILTAWSMLPIWATLGPCR